MRGVANLDVLLEKTSRTFALSIPMLPEPTRRHVALAYLLFRVADTFEDAAQWPRDRRLAALDDLTLMLETPGGEEATAGAQELDVADVYPGTGLDERLTHDATDPPCAGSDEDALFIKP